MKIKYSLYSYFIMICTIITFFLSIIVEKDDGYKFIFFIPLFYFIFFLLFKRIHKYSAKYKGLFLLNIFMFIKYVFAIFLICIFKNYDVPKYYAITISDTSYYYATVLMIVEMLTIFTSIELFSDKIYKKSLKSLENIEKNNYLKYKISPFLLSFLIISVFLVVLNWNLFINKSLIIFSNANSITETIETDNLIGIIFNIFKTIIMGLLINRCIRKYQISNNIRYIIISYIVMAIYVFLSISTSRINMILPFIFFIILTRDRFGKFGKILNIVCIILLVNVFSLVSIYKNPWKYTQTSKVYESLIEFSTGIQEYTSNIMPTAAGLQTINYYGGSINLTTFINDFAGSIPLVSHFVNQDNRIYRLYNIYVLKENTMSQLIPMTVSSMAYFSIAFCWVLVFINVIFLMYFDNLMKIKKNTYLEEYISLYLLFIFASCLYSNVQMLSGRFFVNYLPIVMILFIDRKFNIKEKYVGNVK